MRADRIRRIRDYQTQNNRDYEPQERYRDSRGASITTTGAMPRAMTTATNTRTTTTTAAELVFPTSRVWAIATAESTTAAMPEGTTA